MRQVKERTVRGKRIVGGRKSKDRPFPAKNKISATARRSKCVANVERMECKRTASEEEKGRGGRTERV